MSWKQAFHFDSKDGLSKKDRKKLRKLENGDKAEVATISDSPGRPFASPAPPSPIGPSIPISSPKQKLSLGSPNVGPSGPPISPLMSPRSPNFPSGKLSSPTPTPISPLAGPSLPLSWAASPRPTEPELLVISTSESTSASPTIGPTLPPSSPLVRLSVPSPTLPPSSPSIGPALPTSFSPSIGPTLPSALLALPLSPIGPSPKPTLSSPKPFTLAAPTLSPPGTLRSLHSKSPSVTASPSPAHLKVPAHPLSPLAQYSTPPLSIHTHLEGGDALSPGAQAEARKRVLGPAAPPPSNFKDVLKEKEELRAWKDRSLFSCDEDFILHTFRKLLADWEEESSGDKVGKRTLASLQEDLKPFLELMKSRGLASSVLDEIEAITVHIYKREYDQAEKIYLNLSIGKDAWPIGIGAGNSYEQGKNRGVAFTVGHLLNDMSVAKYIKSIKRLITFAREHFPA